MILVTTCVFTYDHNGNRLTQTSNGTQSQSFTYDAHDKLTSGTIPAETDGHDLNGNETSIVFGGRPITLVYDEEDRLTSFTTLGITDTFTYNGLGLRVGKVDSTGSYSYVCDGTSPASPVLSDGHALYTPGLSENRSGTSSYYSFDKLGNLWTLDGSSKSLLAYEDNSGFGGITASGGSNPSPFKFSGGNGGQSDADTGLTLLGHRYYDGRQGRFISQDPAGEGDNWYAYAGNNPVNNTDPTGLMIAGGSYDPSQAGIAYNPNNNVSDQYMQDNPGSYNFYVNGQYDGTKWMGATTFDQMSMSGGGMGPGAGMGMFAASQHQAARSQWYRSKSGDHGIHVHKGQDGPRYNRQGKEIDARGIEKKGGGNIRGSQLKDFQRVFDELNPPRPAEAAAAAEAPAARGEGGGGGGIYGAYFPGQGFAPNEMSNQMWEESHPGECPPWYEE